MLKKYTNNVMSPEQYQEMKRKHAILIAQRRRKNK